MDRVRARGRLSMALVTVVGLAAAACGGSPAATVATGGELLWALPSDPMGLARSAGLQPDAREYLDYHVHAHLDVFLNGARVNVPGGIGIAITDPAVQHDPPENYGGIPEEGCAQACISPLHTHNNDGIIHVEAQEVTGFTLGQFFASFAVPLDAQCVGDLCSPALPIAVYVDGQQQSGNPADIVLRDLQQISIVIGTPPAEIPSSFSGG